MAPGISTLTYLLTILHIAYFKHQLTSPLALADVEIQPMLPSDIGPKHLSTYQINYYTYYYLYYTCSVSSQTLTHKTTSAQQIQTDT